MAEPTIVVTFTLKGTGWADIDLRVGDQIYTLNGVSYTTDALGDLPRLALVLATGGWTARASFDGEPIEWRLIAGSIWDGQAWRKGFFVRVLTFAEFYKMEPDEAGHLAFETESNTHDFASAVLKAAQRVRELHDAKSYVWGNYPFPMRALRVLETALANEDSPVPSQDPDTNSYIVYPRKND